MKFLDTIKMLLLLLATSRLGSPYTIIMSNSGGPPSSLVDVPQSKLAKSNIGAQTDPREQEAVYDIMRATGNEWATEIPDVCHGRWHGIECMPDNDNVLHVVSLSFGALSVDTAFPTCDPTRSYISPSVTKLPHLRTLFFYHCFRDKPQPIPSFLGQLGTSLQTLVLRENGHVGPIPHGLGNLSHLTVLDLHRNNLSGSIPISLGQIIGLKSLDLSYNRLTGPIPNISLSSLNVFDINHNYLKGPLPISLLNTNSLIKVDLSRNQLTGPIPNMSMTNLILLDLSYNTLTAPLPESLENLKSLQALILNGNPSISTTIPKNLFEGLSNLMILGLSNMKLEGSIPESLGRLTSLRVLHLDDNQLNGTIPTSFANLSGLSELRLNNNKLTGPIPFQIEKIWKMGKKLRLDNNLGLCYDPKNGLGDDLDSLSGAGIGLCNEPENWPTTSVQHISTSNEEILKSSIISSSAVKKLTVSRGMSVFGLGALFLFVSYFVLTNYFVLL